MSWWQAEKCRDGSNVLQQCTQSHCPCLGVDQVPVHRIQTTFFTNICNNFDWIGLQLHPDILGVELTQSPQLSTVTAGHNFQLKFGMDPKGKVRDSSL